MQIIILLFILKSSLAWHDSCRIAWDGVGTKVYDEDTTNTNECPSPNPVQLDSEGNPTNPCCVPGNAAKYYGPFRGSSSQGINYEYEVSCENYGTMTITYSVATCNVDYGDRKAKTQLFFNYEDSSTVDSNGENKPKYGSGGGGAAELADSVALKAKISDACTNWVTQTFTFPNKGPVRGHEPINIKIRNRISRTSEYESLYDLEITCTQLPCTTDCEYTESEHPVSLESYCVSGLSDDINGIYSHIEEPYINGNPVYKKDNSYPVAYWISIGADPTTNNTRWAIVENTANPTTYVYVCTTTSLYEINMMHTGFTGLDGNADEGYFKDSNGVIVAGVIKNGACNDHYTANIFGISDQTKTIGMLIMLSLFSCILGMMTLYCCQLICYNRKKKNYSKVSNKDIDF